MPIKIEKRAYRLESLELRADDSDPSSIGRLVGHAAVFNSLSHDLGGFKEQVAPGAFRQSIVDDDVVALFNHNDDIVLGRNRAGTLRLSEDATGLLMEINLPATQGARDLKVSIDRGDVNGASFQFRTQEDTWAHVDDGDVLRTLKRVQLFDVSPVTMPAYPETDVAARSFEVFQEQEARQLADAEAGVKKHHDWLRARQRQMASGL